MEEEFNKLLTKIRSYNDNNSDIEFITKAWIFTKLAHSGQKRLSGEPYASHGLETAKILANLKMDTTSIVAGFLHDTVEDGAAKREDIEREFGSDVAVIVDGVTKVSNIKLRGSKEEEFIENLRKMFLAMAEDLRVVLVKLADRLHNMQTLSALASEKQVRIARETLEVFAPLAERLGIGEIRSELEDLAFPYVYPEEYQKVFNYSSPFYKKAEIRIKKMKNNLLKKLASVKVKAKISGRKKGLYSLWRKLERPGVEWDFSKVNDIVALRILVDDISDCYVALGVVHNTYKPVPHIGVSDFIAQPKPNGYRSIHTKVFDISGEIVEIQIKTFEMHQENEYGIAAHWHLSSLKSSGKISSDDIDRGKINIVSDKLSWVKQLADWQNEIKDSKEFLKAVKFDALSERIFVFSPKGDVYDLPTGATPVDYAFGVHTNLGFYIKSVKVNGRIVPLEYKLKSGDMVEIVKTKNFKKPSEKWIDFVRTTEAKREIMKQLRKQDV